MFRNAGPNRTHRQNGLLAGYLALVAGYVNAVGLVVLGMFTSHMSGNVSRLARELASQHFGAAAAGLLLVGSFFGGAVIASLVIESSFFGPATNAYGVALSLEALLVCSFAVPGRLAPALRPDLPELQAAVLCSAMGIQNSLVTRLSGAVVRTTHLTGIVTDLGIEAARWLRWWRALLSPAARSQVAVGGVQAERPSAPKIALLAVIAATFTVGAVVGTLAAVAVGRAAALVPVLALVAGAAYAFATRDARGTIPPPRSR